jgi:acylphosphatase
MRRVHAIISGHVQGVSYRASTAAEAGRLRLTGWVRNRADGTVELEAEGPADVVARLLEWCKRGPPSASVDDVAVTELAPTGADKAFSITR